MLPLDTGGNYNYLLLFLYTPLHLSGSYGYKLLSILKVYIKTRVVNLWNAYFDRLKTSI